jgi:predicted transcriptional regulator
MSTVTIALSDEQMQRLQELARANRLAPEELLRARVEEWLERPEGEFRRAADYVLRKNADLYRRLA